MSDTANSPTTPDHPVSVADPPEDEAPTRTGPGHGAPPLRADDDDESEIAPDSLRVDPQVGEELFGALYSRIKSYGSAVFGNHNTINNFASPSLKPIVGQLANVTELLEAYATSDADGSLDKILARHAVACLTGPRTSGRFTTACAALARRYTPDRVYEVSLPAGALPGALLEHPDVVLAERGYVLRLAGDGHVETMRTLANLFHQRSAALLLIKNEGAREQEPHRNEVRHRQPDPLVVFRKHLEQRLRLLHGLSDEKSMRTVDHYLEWKGLRGELQHTCGPREVVRMVEMIGDAHPLSDAGMETILSISQPWRRRRASRILLPAEDAPSGRRRRDNQHERAFRIAYAVFGRQPLHYVFESAAWLLAEIDDAALRPEWGHMALQHPVQDLLGDELREDWLGGRATANSSYGSARSAWIRDTGLRGAILDVAWHDFDGSRGSLLKWLDRLAREGDETMIRAAAETAALLAHHDFDRIHEQLVDGWAISPNPRIRQAAAWVETIAYLGGHADRRILEKLRDWCYGTSNYRRDTAARVYASGLQQRVLAWSMSDLRQIAADRLQLRKYAVAEAVNQLYEPDRAAWLIAELGHWVDSPGVRVHAARALLVMAEKPAVDSDNGSPELLLRLAAGEVSSDGLAKVWRMALVEPDVSASAWPILVRWLRCVDVDAQLQRPIAVLVENLSSKANMRRRILFYLRKHWGRGPMPLWVRQMLEE